ncbi:hypothetical protein E3O06_00010 [Cryobacterium glaciale]|uniref:Uncharacterized protein n=1 Tax=Cryobacterium glaciale TaxID=1259145 RepID=A0A4R8V8R1_9MICO|nr:hypothetical protein [Cryobacterium glaciale]TFB77905.1 hypothetical protein E3O06_00010 [Cryobacterium glaciale]
MPLTLMLWPDSPDHTVELLGADSRLSTELIEAYNESMRELLAEAVGDVVPASEAAEFTELLLAFT